MQARLVRVAKGVRAAEAVAIEEPSPDRRVRRPSDPLCGGCLYSHIAYPRQLEIKSQVIADAFTRIGRLELPAPVDRRRIARRRLPHARATARARRAGSDSSAKSTHDLCDARRHRVSCCPRRSMRSTG